MDVQDSRKDALPGSRFTRAEGRIVTNWNALVGQTVQVWRYNEVVDEGRVESVTYDGRVLWLAQSGPIERRLVEKERGTGLRVRLVD
ncbi:hypothetical protein J2Y66_002902 [Paenarthrobacter nitroguajacolicus]|uniref:hypothetical protein n=1 Tax=Paenarthrobacter TaxID=1742992 RepID=UPI00285FF730|nr:hypothetical protein [Paenarthrobacter nitroguajacolicus]MDR6988398.1 hypothetical protein [Paenarthrobacter nitroguajacolicus]